MQRLQNSLKEKNFYLVNQSLPIFLVGQVHLYKKIVFICSNDEEMDSLKSDIKLIDNTVKVFVFPNLDSILFTDINPTKNILNTRINTLCKLAIMQFENIICLITESAILTKCIPKNILMNRYSLIQTKKKTNQNIILKFLKNHNYNNVDSVRQHNDYSIRGSLIDVFPSNLSYPLRLDFFGTSLDSIRIFDPISQLSKKEIKQSFILPANEFFLDTKNIEKFRINFRNANQRKKEEFYDKISSKIQISGIHNFYPFLYNELSSVLDYLDNYVFICRNDIWENLHLEEEKIEESFAKSDYKNFYPITRIVDNTTEIKKRITEKNVKYFSSIENFSSSKEFIIFSKNLNISKSFESEGIIEEIKGLVNEYKKKAFIIFTYKNNFTKQKIKNIFEDSCHLQEIDTINNLKMYRIYLFQQNLNKSFVIKREELIDYIFISDQDIFGVSKYTSTKKKINAENILSEISNFKENDLVVHSEHGIGKFLGLINIKLYDQKHECIQVEYGGGDKIFIPVENLELISKYGNENLNVTLDRLGSKNWQLRKAGIKNKIKLIANDLLKIAAERSIKNGIKIQASSDEYTYFASKFEFAETSDQLVAIKDIENDLSSGKCMDRLICGDVGFGKTEVAMRASFIVANSGYQVAFICPTTLLVRQHYKNLLERFYKTDILVLKLSRFEKKSERDDVILKLKTNKKLIIVGTHALLSDDIDFKNLGLLVIDEEQSFGVEQKEKIKNYKSNIHVLTLTATPIPRTLQFSVLGIKDISLITTPPINRNPIKTFLTRYDKSTIRNVIRNEMSRNGQIFYITPRIREIESIRKKLSYLVPECNLGIAHGRLSGAKLNDVYERFSRKKIDILISTSIIESGIDIPNANTIIVEKPNFFGLSQIYQIRGRVGRSDKQAYAFFIIEENKKMTEKAEKRLEIINNLESLGAGFQLASYDLDLRGSGNILGSEQSGHIKEIGFELYQKLIQDSINDLKNNKKTFSDWSPQINLGLPTLIPDDYIKEVDIRLSFYRRISNTFDLVNLKKIFLELQDRFGELPKELINLSTIIKVKNLCKSAEIKKIDLGNKGVMISFRENINNAKKVIEIIKQNPECFKIRPNNKILFCKDWSSQKTAINDIINLLTVFTSK